ncbi:conserved virulence factor C family protein [Staphylococcus intermedius]|uniref:Conserved virulence factor C n=1 Tax=Staphylococcus intermedius NCTC 11048 TaxID=1141106 RepID=A0A380G6S1_STAIN|nr:conserved virulence factor C family protein [Staphylococcus intermedius]PCF64914.1 virulence factor [Staphylococcus intermedius]PCF80524.1 virulence factor [Staphylococcus intermedius]PCF81874.1 virulence factor [Staphylococcus intermedius]PCF88211.1 virulence factor [Staphylococcus intermedius]PCF88925.1 virulence factor [Staphylococcus intermedius]
MEIMKVEPTPSPNTMKIILSEKRQDNHSNTYTQVAEGQPHFINAILQVEGVKSVFYVLDFIAVDKTPKADWETVLPLVTATLNHEQQQDTPQPEPDTHFGEVKAEVLKFKNIPYQVKLTTSKEEKRQQLSDIFVNAMLETQAPHDNVVFLRKWETLGIRYGDLDDVMQSVVEEVDALYPEHVLKQLVEEAKHTDVTVPQKQYAHVTLEAYQQESEWKARLRMLKSFPTPTQDDYPLLDYALNEDKVPLRREAVVLLSMIEDPATLPYLYKGLHDKSPAVRRTAGDSLSDLGFKEALPEMEKALDDPQKIVRWRAAMFLFDEGEPDQLPALKAHQNDPAYEVKLQIEMAITRIENGEEALGSVWKQIANRNQ